jgi:ubiquinone/menaquinone biosynthesis C-methylase UbiE
MFQRYLDGQYRRPSGLVGRWVGAKMAEQHQPENQWTINLLDLQPNDKVLEVGFGPGIAVQAAAERANFVAGVDFSKTMVGAASRRNAEAIRAKRVDLLLGDAKQLPFEDNFFDKAFSIHSIYFWQEPLTALKEIYRVLKPKGKVVLTVLPKERWNEGNPDAPVGTPECRPYTGEELSNLLRQAGFSQTQIKSDANRELRSNYSVIAQRA